MPHIVFSAECESLCGVKPTRGAVVVSGSYLASKVRIAVCCLFSSLFAQLIHMTAAAASAATAAFLVMGAAGVQERHFTVSV